MAKAAGSRGCRPLREEPTGRLCGMPKSSSGRPMVDVMTSELRLKVFAVYN